MLWCAFGLCRMKCRLYCFYLLLAVRKVVEEDEKEAVKKTLPMFYPRQNYCTALKYTKRFKRLATLCVWISGVTSSYLLHYFPTGFFFQGILGKIGSRVSNRVRSKFGSVFNHKNKQQEKKNKPQFCLRQCVLFVGESVAMVRGNHEGTGRDSVWDILQFCCRTTKMPFCLPKWKIE